MIFEFIHIWLSHELFVNIFLINISVILIKITDDTDDRLNLYIDFKAEPFSVLIYGEDQGAISSKCKPDWASGYHGRDLGADQDVCGAHFLQGTNLPFDKWVVIYKFNLKDVSKGFSFITYVYSLFSKYFDICSQDSQSS